MNIYYYEKSLDEIHQPWANISGYLILILNFVFFSYWILSVVCCYYYIKDVKYGKNYERMLPTVDLSLSRKSDGKHKPCSIFV